jgi:parvulin-like peptidyl-prolyl isomerase
VGDKWVIIEVTAKRAKTDVTLAQAHDDIRDEIFKTKLDAAARDWLTDLFDKSSKEINRSLWE